MPPCTLSAIARMFIEQHLYIFNFLVQAMVRIKCLMERICGRENSNPYLLIKEVFTIIVFIGPLIFSATI